jgi:hypothetical protein
VIIAVPDRGLTAKLAIDGTSAGGIVVEKASSSKPSPLWAQPISALAPAIEQSRL